MKYILGVDGGGTKTYAVIIDEKGNKLGSGISGCGNHQSIGMDAAFKNIQSSIMEALNKAELTYQDINYVQYGLAGADRPKDFQIIEPALATLPFEKWSVVCDTFEGLRIGSADNYGVVLVCGTGTNAAGRNVFGEAVQTGGFGYFYGDNAGGSEMAIEIFRSAIRSWEMREIPSMLVDTVPKFLGYESMEELFNDYLDNNIYSVPGELTIALHETASAGDELAINLLKATGEELGKAAKSVIKRLGGFEKFPIPVVLVGSVLQKGKSPHLLSSLKTTMEEEYPSIELVIPEMAPVYGAILLGMDQLQIPVTEEITQKFVSYGGYQD